MNDFNEFIKTLWAKQSIQKQSRWNSCCSWVCYIFTGGGSPGVTEYTTIGQTPIAGTITLHATALTSFFFNYVTCQCLSSKVTCFRMHEHVETWKRSIAIDVIEMFHTVELVTGLTTTTLTTTTTTVHPTPSQSSFASKSSRNGSLPLVLSTAVRPGSAPESNSISVHSQYRVGKIIISMF